MIKGIEDTVVGFNVVLACEDSERFTEGKNKILECLKILNEKSCDELKNSSENYLRDFADKSIFKQHMFTRVTFEHLCAYPERYKELENLSFLLGGNLKSDKTVYDLHDIDIENFVLNLTKLLYAVSGIPVGINLAAFPDKGSVTWGAHMFSYADENKSKMTDLWSLDFSFDYNDDDDVIFEVVDREEFEEWNEKIYKEILSDLSNPEKSRFYRKIIGKKNCKKMILENGSKTSVFDNTAKMYFEKAMDYLKIRRYGALTPEIWMLNLLSSKEVQSVFNDYSPESAVRLESEIEIYLCDNQKKIGENKNCYAKECFLLLSKAYEIASDLNSIEIGKTAGTRSVSVSLYDLLIAFYETDFYVSELIRSIIPDEKIYKDLLIAYVDGIR